MDPNAAYMAFRAALLAGQTEAAREICRDLKEWLVRGGFEPSWTARQRRHFFEFSSKGARRD